jgi:hypothetical protein
MIQLGRFSDSPLLAQIGLFGGLGGAIAWALSKGIATLLLGDEINRIQRGLAWLGLSLAGGLLFVGLCVVMS